MVSHELPCTTCEIDLNALHAELNDRWQSRSSAPTAIQKSGGDMLLPLKRKSKLFRPHGIEFHLQTNLSHSLQSIANLGYLLHAKL